MKPETGKAHDMGPISVKQTTERIGIDTLRFLYLHVWQPLLAFALREGFFFRFSALQRILGQESAMRVPDWFGKSKFI